MGFAGRFKRLVRRSRAPSSHGRPAPPVLKAKDEGPRREPRSIREWLEDRDNLRLLVLLLAFALVSPLFEIGVETLLSWLKRLASTARAASFP